MLKPNHVLDFQPICTFFPWGEGIEDTELQPFLDFSQFCPSSPWERGLRIPNPNHVWDFQLICTFSSRERELRIPKPNRVWDFQPICPLSPWERVRERAVSRRLTFRFLVFAKNLLKVRSNRRSRILKPLRQILFVCKINERSSENVLSCFQTTFLLP